MFKSIRRTPFLNVGIRSEFDLFSIELETKMVYTPKAWTQILQRQNGKFICIIRYGVVFSLRDVASAISTWSFDTRACSIVTISISEFMYCYCWNV